MPPRYIAKMAHGPAGILDFRYDQTGAPYSLTYTVGSTSTIYYYITSEKHNFAKGASRFTNLLAPFLLCYTFYISTYSISNLASLQCIVQHILVL